MNSTFKNGLVRVSTEFLTEVLISVTENRVPPDSVATGVYYDPADDAFVFVIHSELLPVRKELETLKEVARVTVVDLSKFFEGFTGRVWGKPMEPDEFVEQGREVLKDFDNGLGTVDDLKNVLTLIVEHFDKEGDDS